MKQLDFVVGGAAGTGIESVAQSVAMAFNREGLHAMTTSEYENLIRGGHSFASVHVAEDEVLSHRLEYQMMIAMDGNSVQLHHKSISDDGCIVYDPDTTKEAQLEGVAKDKLIAVPLAAIAKEAGFLLAANVVAVGAVFALLGRGKAKMETVLQSLFARKGEKIVQINLTALAAGFDFVEKNYQRRTPFTATGDGVTRALMGGNEAIVLGAIRAGCKLVAAYPMTPGSTILTTAAKESRNYDMVVVHAEDEIAAAMMAIGSNHAGVRACTGTSGGGFALMGESVSFCGQTEIPMVYFNAQRPGPSTGLPTRTGQGDLRMAMHCGQGDFPRIVVAAGTHRDCVQLGAEVFNLADEYQVPVIMLTEKYLADQYRSCDHDISDGIEIRRGKVWDGAGEFERFAITDDGVSPRACVGTAGGQHTTTSYEHTPEGKAEEEVEGVIDMMDKRWRKRETMLAALPDPICTGDAPIKLVVWGGTTLPALGAQQLLAADGIEIEVVQMQYILPFKTEWMRNKLSADGARYLIFECNQGGQLEGVITQHTGLEPEQSFRDYAGRPPTAELIATELREYLAGK